MKQKIAEYKYIYDPNHENKPAGNWNRTNSGWSSNCSNNESLIKTTTKTEPAKQTKPVETTDEPEEDFSLDETTPSEEDKFSLDDTAAQEDTKFSLDDAETTEGETEEDTDQEDEFLLDDVETSEEEADEDKFSLDDAAAQEDTTQESADQEDKFSLDDEPAESKEQEFSLDDEATDESEDKFSLDDEASTEEEFSLDDEPTNESEEEFSLDEPEDTENEPIELEESDDYFNDEKKAEFLKEENYDSYIEKMNTFIETFDEGEGKDNNVTFKAVAQNLDWSKDSNAKAFADHCANQNLSGAEEVIAFLYYHYNNDATKFEEIINLMH